MLGELKKARDFGYPENPEDRQNIKLPDNMRMGSSDMAIMLGRAQAYEAGIPDSQANRIVAVLVVDSTEVWGLMIPEGEDDVPMSADADLVRIA